MSSERLQMQIIRSIKQKEKQRKYIVDRERFNMEGERFKSQAIDYRGRDLQNQAIERERYELEGNEQELGKLREFERERKFGVMLKR